MSDQVIRTTIFAALRQIAPEADPSSIDPNVSLRDQLDIDSMDLLNLFIRLHRELVVEIPEVDYPKLSTINGCIAYLKARLPQPV
jgi:acyl carrier protein